MAELGLTDTRYVETEDDWVDPHAQGHQPAEGQVELNFNNFSSMGASGAMGSTTDDMTVWAEALATSELISPELHDQRLVGAPLTERPEYDEYALGIGSLDGWWDHTGEGQGFTALAMHDVESEASVVISMDISNAVVSSEGGEEVYRQRAHSTDA
ncbi:CubicO group peptidase (beta-lactamase class C family) [Enteractinococcus fodinae]|uniref:CubicO group peptidase (Beta-lactamase class C family) n=1 Tax=Enteractinococcus fodinae TaxID=684663 RepID=A0ABU2B6E5_9MICC|nr:CubicO group peptidase (beta-lactamase class C family) [Enteractinococcus fodinae]